jgi:hypothetical protein
MLQPIDALLLIWTQARREAWRHRHVWDVGDVAETRDMRCDRGAILPARGDQFLQVEYGGRLAGIQFQCLAVETAGGRDQVVHHRQQPGDPFLRQLQAAVGEAGDHLAIDDPGRRRCRHAAQAQQDRQQRMARLQISMPRSSENFPPGASATCMSVADRSNQARTEACCRSGCASRVLQCRNTLGDKALPGFRSIAATKDKHHPALRCLAGSHPHLHKAVPTDGVNPAAFTDTVAAHKDQPLGSVRMNCRSSSNGTTAPP